MASMNARRAQVMDLALLAFISIFSIEFKALRILIFMGLSFTHIITPCDSNIFPYLTQFAQNYGLGPFFNPRPTPLADFSRSHKNANECGLRLLGNRFYILCAHFDI